MTSVKVSASAPGKVNLFFAVGPLLDDGYHSVASVYLALDLRDTVTVSESERWDVQVVGNLPQEQLNQVPKDESNLVVKAAKWLAALTHHHIEKPIAFEITKNIPVAGGMGGGSADAAATLIALNELWELGLPREELISASVELGADIPFAILGYCAEGLGRGEILTPISVPGQINLTVVPASYGLSTPAVYRRIDEMRGSTAKGWPTPHVVADFERALREGDVVELSRHTKNELQPAAISIAPMLSEPLELGAALGSIRSFVSGSGPTTAHLVESRESAIKLAENFGERNILALPTSGPAEGARLELN